MTVCLIISFYYVHKVYIDINRKENVSVWYKSEKEVIKTPCIIFVGSTVKKGL